MYVSNKDMGFWINYHKHLINRPLTRDEKKLIKQCEAEVHYMLPTKVLTYYIIQNYKTLENVRYNKKNLKQVANKFLVSSNILKIKLNIIMDLDNKKEDKIKQYIKKR